MKAFIRVEKCMACDLKPGELFIVDLPDVEYFNREMNRSDVALSVLVRTNVSDADLEDREQIVWKLNLTVTLNNDTVVARLDPHKPPGFEDF